MNLKYIFHMEKVTLSIETYVNTMIRVKEITEIFKYTQSYIRK